MVKLSLVWTLAAVALLGTQSTNGKVCICSSDSCFLTRPNTEFFNGAERSCSKFRSKAHELTINEMLDGQLPPAAFEKFPNITSLEMFEGKLAQLNSDTFSSAGKLTRLMIFANRVTRLEDFTFKGVDNLKDLIISFNPLNTVAENSFSNLRQLKVLTLEHGAIMMLPKRVFQNNRMLKSITLNGNKLASIDSEVFDGLDKLTKLELASNQLKVFDFKFLKVPVIALGNNSLERLVVNEHYKEIYASKNKLRRIEFDGTSLIKLSLIENEINDISNITKLVNLKSLSLGKNNLNPNSVFSSLTSLEELMLRSTYINLTANTFAGLNKLNTLDLSQNYYTEADFKIFNSQKSLQVVSYVGNQIESFNFTEAKQYLPALRVLQICENGWNDTYFAANVKRMQSLSLSVDVREDNTDYCTEQIIENSYESEEAYTPPTIIDQLLDI